VTEGDIDSKTLRDMLDRGEPVTVVDVRKAEDHAEWSVPGSVNLDAHDRWRGAPRRPPRTTSGSWS
jgi:rhodanese-related sulfurtransferase